MAENALGLEICPRDIGDEDCYHWIFEVWDGNTILESLDTREHAEHFVNAMNEEMEKRLDEILARAIKTQSEQKILEKRLQIVMCACAVVVAAAVVISCFKMFTLIR